MIAFTIATHVRAITRHARHATLGPLELHAIDSSVSTD